MKKEGACPDWIPSHCLESCSRTKLFPSQKGQPALPLHTSPIASGSSSPWTVGQSALEPEGICSAWLQGSSLRHPCSERSLLYKSVHLF